jgi:hypothetical protein
VPNDRHAGVAFALLVAGFLVYAGLFIYRTSFIVAGERYFSLFDDAMVSMRYARNLAEGHGLVWNPGGERVAGYTNPLWVVYMSLVHLLPISPSKTSLIVQITEALLLALNLLCVRRIALAVTGGVGAVAFGAAALTASYLPINYWSLEGMEVGALALLISVCCLQAIRSFETGAFSRGLYALLAIGVLVRLDMAVAFAAFLSLFLIVDPAHRRLHVKWGLALLAIAVGAETLFGLWYYGDPLPNTYYLKLTGVPPVLRIMRGAYVFAQFVWHANPLLFLLASTLALRRDKRLTLLCWLFGIEVAYSIYVGGDAWEYWGGSNRFITVVMPEFFVLLAYALYLLIPPIVEMLRDRAVAWQPTPRRMAWMFAMALAYAAVSLNSIHGPGALAEALLIRPPLHTGHGGENQEDVVQALLLRRLTDPSAIVAVMRAGTVPYFSNRPSVDMLGKNDRYIARRADTAPPASVRDFRPGHMKFDFAYSIAGREPDVIIQLRRRADLARPFLGGYDGRLLESDCAYFRRDSQKILWDRLTAPRCRNAAPEQSGHRAGSSSNLASGLSHAVIAGS